nr:HGGxSTG domain-containing protein [Ruegeria sp. ANG-S4]
MAELGLNDDGEQLPKSERPQCGAKTRAGGQCHARVVPGKRRCRLHGGLSTGPKGKNALKTPD